MLHHRIAILNLLVAAGIAGTSAGADVPPGDLEQIRLAAPFDAPAKPKKPRKVLVFSKADGFVHDSIPWGAAALKILGEKTGAYAATLSDDPALFDRERLFQFDAVVMNNNCGNPIADPQRRANLLEFVRSGRGLVGIHCAAHLAWPEYTDLLGGYSISHPWNAGSRVVVKLEEPDHPLVAGFCRSSFEHTDEIFIFDHFSPEKVRVLLSLDTEKTDMKKPDVERAGGSFPLSWTKSYGQGRVFYCAFGHQKDVYWRPNILKHYLAGIQFALGDLDETPRKAAEDTAGGSRTDPAVEKLTKEVAGKGWILFSAKSDQGDYDLFLCRPDGAQRRNLTNTPQWSEFGGRFLPDGKRMLYRRVKKGDPVNHDKWGAAGTLVFANADGSNPVAQGRDGELPWASWDPDCRRFACLEDQIRIRDAETKKVLKELPRQGIFQQLFWSPDGKRLCGVANLHGRQWNIISIELATGKATLLTRALNCTPDWFQHDPNRVVYSNRTPGIGDGYGFTMLMQATADGKSRTLVCGESKRHIYFGCTSPDDKYVVFSRPEHDGGIDGPMAMVRMADTPMVVPTGYKDLLELYPGAKEGPVLRLPYAGFEPHWTYAERGDK